MRAVSKALLILDQVPYQRFVTAISPTWPQPSQVVLNHIPRTTPVGHATISTGREPRDHRIQGRLWYVRTGARWDLVNIDDVPRGNGFPPNIERLLRQSILGFRILVWPRQLISPRSFRSQTTSASRLGIRLQLARGLGGKANFTQRHHRVVIFERIWCRSTPEI